MTDAHTGSRAAAPQPALALDNVSFSYTRSAPVIRNCTLDVMPGRVLAILGPNGSGKTTLLKLMAGALQPAGGTVTVNGRVAYVPQFIQLSFAYSVLDVVLMGRARQIGLFSTPSSHDEHIAATALERVGMLSFASRSFEELSGGERQLIAFARALAAEATVLVLDEPAAALDLSHQRVVLQWIQRLARDDGLTVVFSTHQPQHADIIADDVALIFGSGRMVVGTAATSLQPELLMELFGIELRRVAVPGDEPGHSILVPNWKL